MRMRLRLGVALAVALAGPVAGEAPTNCADLVQTVEGLTGLSVTAPPAAPGDGWCVLDGARLSWEGATTVTAQRLRIAGTDVEGELLSLNIDGAGLKVKPALNDRDMAWWLRDLMRLQTADVRLSLRRDDAGDRLLVETARLELSGGSEVVLLAEVAGADLSASSVLTGRVTKLYVEWKNDGRTLRPIMEAWGAELDPQSTGTKAILVARNALLDLVEAVPESSLLEGAPEALEQFIEALPQGRGRLMLAADSGNGIGAAQLGLLALAEDPAGPEALGRFFTGTRISVSWTPGLSP